MPKPLMISVEVNPIKCIAQHTSVMLVGSCFAENIGSCLHRNQVDTIVNPWGILYNPVSIASNLLRALEGESYTEKDLFLHDELWRSWSHHGIYASTAAEAVLERMNADLTKAIQFVPNPGVLVITLGSAWVYSNKDQIVANCHKVPTSSFEHRLLSVHEIVTAFQPVLSQLHKETTTLFTVSPVRYVREGIHQSNISKSTLFLAIEALQKSFPKVAYFPAYELVVDQLRDYRYYKEDLVHPNQQAIDFVWEHFKENYCTSDCLKMMEEWEPIYLGLQHRLLHPDTQASVRFVAGLKNKLEKFGKKYDKSIEEGMGKLHVTEKV